MWPNWAKNRHFGKHLKWFGNIVRVYLVFGTILKDLWHILFAFGLISIVVTGHIMKNKFAIWSHWLLTSRKPESWSHEKGDFQLMPSCFHCWIGSQTYRQRILSWFVRGSITARMTSCLDSAGLLMLKEKQIYLFGQIQTSQTRGQPYNDTSPY